MTTDSELEEARSWAEVVAAKPRRHYTARVLRDLVEEVDRLRGGRPIAAVHLGGFTSEQDEVDAAAAHHQLLEAHLAPPAHREAVEGP